MRFLIARLCRLILNRYLKISMQHSIGVQIVYSQQQLCQPLAKFLREKRIDNQPYILQEKNNWHCYQLTSSGKYVPLAFFINSDLLNKTRQTIKLKFSSHPFLPFTTEKLIYRFIHFYKSMLRNKRNVDLLSPKTFSCFVFYICHLEGFLIAIHQSLWRISNPHHFFFMLSSA